MISRKLVALTAIMVFAMSALFLGTGGVSIQTASADCPAGTANGTVGQGGPGFPAPQVPNSGAQCQTASVTTSASINGGTSAAAPRIECKWELPDMDPATAGMQYATPNAAASNDDDPAVDAAGPNRCALPPGAAPVQSNGVTNAIQVRALDHNQNLPIPVRMIELWAAVDHPVGLGLIQDVYWDVFQPCAAGTPNCGGANDPAGHLLKVQVHYDSGCAVAPDVSNMNCNGAGTGVFGNHPGNVPERDGTGAVEDTCRDTRGLVATTYSPCTNQAVANGLGRIDWMTAPGNGQACTALGGSTATSGTMWEAALDTGQIVSANVVDDPTWGMKELCREKVKAFFHAYISLTKDEPCGTYQVNAVAVAVGGNSSTLSNSFDVLCGINLQTDFTSFNWGTVFPGIQGDIAGDLIFGTANRPTIANGNNGAMAVKIKFSQMTNGTDVTKIIDKFDAAFGRSSSDLNSIGYQSPFLNAGVDYELGVAGPVGQTSGTVQSRWVLCANEKGKLDVSIHPAGNLPNGAYTGTATITGYLSTANQAFCYGNLHVTETPAPPIP